MERKKFVLSNKRIHLLAAIALIAAAGAVAYATSRHESSSENRVISAQENIIKAGQWSYMSGAELKSDGLHIMHRDFRIVEQNGSGGQPNPPVNEYGTYLKVPDNFTLRASLNDVKGPASLQLYASPPIVSDEFRVEPKSIRLTFDQGKLTVRRWNGKGTGDLANQGPVGQKTFAIPATLDLSVTVTHKNHTLTLAVNDNEVGTIAAGDTFQQGSIWFGADAEERDGHFTISALKAEAQDGGQVSVVDTSALPVAAKRADGLQELAKKRRDGFLIGADVALWAVTSDPAYRQRLFGGDFGVVTPENELKWQFTEPLPNTFDFHQADALVAEAKKHNMKVHGHNLVFSEALPQWVQDMPTDTPEQKARAKQVLVNHVTTLVSHFKGSIDEWDINEIFADYDDDGNFTSVFRDNVFYRAMGADYVRVAAEAARKANPNVKIWLNDFGAENDTGSRWQAMFQTIKSWKQAGIPIYGVGFQSHIYDTSTDLIVDKNGQSLNLRKNIQDLASIGVMSRISELDAPVNGEYDGSSQSRQFVGVLKTCIELPSCKAVSFWSIGPTDRYQNDEHRLQPVETDSLFGPTMIPAQSYEDLQKFLR